MRGVPPRDLPGGRRDSREADGPILAAGRGTGQIRRVPHAAGHWGRWARQLGAP